MSSFDPNTQSRRSRIPMTNSVSLIVPVAVAIPIIGTIDGVLRTWAMRAPDGTVESTQCVLNANPGYNRSEAKTGMWRVSLVQEVGENRFVALTQEVQVRGASTSGFALGSSIAAMEPSRSVLLQIRYSSTSGPAPLFWDGVSNLSATIQIA